MSTPSHKLQPRPPIIVVMGHIDHGKSTLLDAVRKSNIVAGEAGGITQHLGAYEVVHEGSDGKKHTITFLDTPGHAAFSMMRSRGARVADVAVLVVSAEEGVKPQTLEALEAILDAKLPYIVALTKIDKTNANIERVKQDLATHSIFIEGYGGTVPCVAISAKTGAGISELLDMMVLMAELLELKGDPLLQAKGIVVESSVDNRRGATATLIITDGTLNRGDTLAVDGVLTPLRMLEDAMGKTIPSATFSAPVRVIGFSVMPAVGTTFQAFASKADAEKALSTETQGKNPAKLIRDRSSSRPVEVPVVLKADMAGTLEALEKEILRVQTDEVGIRVLHAGVGPVSENDVKAASGSQSPIIIAFHVKVERAAQTYAEQLGVTSVVSDVIYEIIDALTVEVERRRPRIQVEVSTGRVKILKIFNKVKEKQVVGGAVTDGKIVDAGIVKILRHDNEIGRGKIVELQAHKLKVKEVEAPNQCGMLVDAKMTIAPGDILESFITETK